MRQDLANNPLGEGGQGPRGHVVRNKKLRGIIFFWVGGFPMPCPVAAHVSGWHRRGDAPLSERRSPRAVSPISTLLYLAKLRGRAERSFRAGRKEVASGPSGRSCQVRSRKGDREQARCRQRLTRAQVPGIPCGRMCEGGEGRKNKMRERKKKKRYRSLLADCEETRLLTMAKIGFEIRDRAGRKAELT